MLVHQNRTITLHPGDVAIGLRGDILQTLLGSCVAIVLTDPRRTIGAMCHIVHAREVAASRQPSGAYANVALQEMRMRLQQHGILASMCEAYVFGGGNMFPDIISGASVGDANVRWVLDALARMTVRILRVDTGGTAYRHLSWTVGPDAPRVEAVQI